MKWTRENPLRLILVVAGTAAGIGLSFFKWGNPDQIQATGFPIPVSIRGFEAAPEAAIWAFADLGIWAIALNTLLGTLVGFVIWAMVDIVRRIRGIA